MTECPMVECPRCGKTLEDCDGFGVVAHVAPEPEPCGYCKHPSQTTDATGMDVCDVCHEDVNRDAVIPAVEALSTGLTAWPVIPSADFYACTRDAETLSFESPHEAIEGRLADEGVRRPSAMTLFCFSRCAGPSPDDMRRLAEVMFSGLKEWWDDSEWANAEAPVDEWNHDALDACAPHIVAAAEAFCRSAEVWPCDVVAEIELPQRYVEALMREHCPEWFVDGSVEKPND